MARARAGLAINVPLSWPIDVGRRSPSGARPGQWRKWRIPVTSIVPPAGRRPSRYQHRASSRRAGRTPSPRLPGTPPPRRGTGRRHRTRTTAPRRTSGPAWARALSTAPRAASTRDVWPEPIPMRRRSLTSTIALDVTPRTRRQASSRSSSSASVGPRAVDRRTRSDGSSAIGVGRGDEDATARGPERAGRVGRGEPAHRAPSAGSTTRRRFGLDARTASAASSNAGRDDDLQEDRGEGLGDRPIHRPGQRDDATEGGDRIAGKRRRPRLEQGRALGGAARVGVLDDDAARDRAAPGRCAAAADASSTLLYESALPWSGGAPVAKGPSIGSRPRPPVAGRPLVRVLAVAECLDLLERDGQARGIRVGGPGQTRLVGQRHAGRGHPRGQDLRDPGVVRRRVAERLDRERRAQPAPHLAVRASASRTAAYRSGDVTIGDIGVVLGRGADHGRPADVDLLDKLVERDPGSLRGGRERVEVDDDELERRDRRRRGAGVGGRPAGGRPGSRHGRAGGAS